MEIVDTAMGSTAIQSSKVKRAAHVLDFLATWPLLYTVNIGLSIFLIAIIIAMMPRTQPTADPRPVVNLAPANILALAQHIAGAHLFGQMPSRSSGGGTAVAPTDIKVQGLLYSDDPAAALAILEVDGNSGSFRVGDTLADGEKLTAIAPTAIQLTQGTMQRVVEMPAQYGGAADGIMLAGDTGLQSPGPLFPGSAPAAGAQSYKPALRTITIPRGASPLDQLRALRQQLIQH